MVWERCLPGRPRKKERTIGRKQGHTTIEEAGCRIIGISQQLDPSNFQCLIMGMLNDDTRHFTAA
eukprot:scaffold107602_cov26-Cyclotella_meneghiniana.AAC.1